MADEHKMQPTQPQGIDPETGKPHKPVAVPIPKRSAFDKLVKRAAKKSASDAGRPSK